MGEEGTDGFSIRYSPFAIRPFKRIGHPMNFQERLADIRARMRDEKIALLVGMHDGAHFIEKPNPVMVLSGFKSLGPAAALLAPDGAMTLVMTPHWDAERAAQCCPDARVVGADNVVEGVLGEVQG